MAEVISLDTDPEESPEFEASAPDSGDSQSSYERTEDQDTLEIQPPQAKFSKKDKSRKHRREDRKKDKKGRERDKGMYKSGSGGSRSSSYHADREQRYQEKDEEAKRREKSRRERERLEKLERERYKINMESQRRAKEHREKMARADREEDRYSEAKRDRESRDDRRRGGRGDRSMKQGYREDDRPQYKDSRSHNTWHTDSGRSLKSSSIGEHYRSRSPSSNSTERRGGTKASRHDYPSRDWRDKRQDRDYDRTKESSRSGGGSRSGSISSRSQDDRYRQQSAAQHNAAIESDVTQQHEKEFNNSDSNERHHAGSEDVNMSPSQDYVHHESPHSPTGHRSYDEDEEMSDSGQSEEGERESDDDESADNEEDDQDNHDPQASKFDDLHEDDSDRSSHNHDKDDRHSADRHTHSDVSQSDGDVTPSSEGEYVNEDLSPEADEIEPVLPSYLPALEGCRSIEQFTCLNRIEEGTYGVVYRAKEKATDEIVALKKLKMEKEKEGFPITSLREINTLLKAQHPNIVTVREIVVGHNMDQIFIVMDYVEHDIKNLMNYSMNEPFMIGEVKTLMIQLLRGVAHLHDNWIIHRDLKTSNLLLSHGGILKIGDFGLAREYGSPLKRYTPIVVTLWYRAPELLLGSKLYSTHIDLWSVGCIFAELLTMKPLFPGKSEIDQLNKIFKDLGTPNERIWQGVSELPAMKKCTFADHPYNQLRNKFTPVVLTDKGLDLMNRFLTYNPARRITAEEALKHEYFTDAPLPVDPSMFPTWRVKNEQSRREKKRDSPKPPSGGKAFATLQEDDNVAQGFLFTQPPRGSLATSGFSIKF